MKIVATRPIWWIVAPMLIAATTTGAQTRSARSQPITEAECVEFGHRLETTFKNGSPVLYVESFDSDALVDRVLSAEVVGKDMTAQMAGFKKGFKSGFEKGFDKQLRQIRRIKFLRVKRVGPEWRILCRTMPAGGGVNYQELVVQRGNDGRLRIADAFIYLSGEMMSDTIKRATIPMLAEQQKSLLERLFGQQPDLVRNFSKWSKFGSLSLAGKYREVLADYAELPPSLQKEKFILAYRLRAALALNDDKEYLAALELWQRTYPRDPSVDLVSIDLFVLRKQYAKALESVNRLDKAVGGDAYMDFQRGALYQLLDEPSKAEAALNHAIETDPQLMEAYFQLAAQRVKDRQFASAVGVLNRLIQNTPLSRENVAVALAREATYAPLLESAEYRRWRGGSSVDALSASSPPGARSAQRGRLTAEGGLRLQSIVYRTKGASATINNKYVMAGDSVEGLKVMAIEKEFVTLETPAGEKKVLTMGEVVK